MMRQKIDPRVPRYNALILPTFIALKELGGSGKNSEILDQVIKDMNLPDEVVDISHQGNVNLSELAYQLAWARTYLSKYGVINNSARSVWSITPEYTNTESIDEKEIVSKISSRWAAKRGKTEKEDEKEVGQYYPPEDEDPSNDDIEVTKDIASILKRINVHLFDHIIIANDRFYSILESKLYDEIEK